MLKMRLTSTLNELTMSDVRTKRSDFIVTEQMKAGLGRVDTVLRGRYHRDVCFILIRSTFTVALIDLWTIRPKVIGRWRTYVDETSRRSSRERRLNSHRNERLLRGGRLVSKEFRSISLTLFVASIVGTNESGDAVAVYLSSSYVSTFAGFNFRSAWSELIWPTVGVHTVYMQRLGLRLATAEHKLHKIPTICRRRTRDLAECGLLKKEGKAHQFFFLGCCCFVKR